MVEPIYHSHKTPSSYSLSSSPLSTKAAPWAIAWWHRRSVHPPLPPLVHPPMSPHHCLPRSHRLPCSPTSLGAPPPKEGRRRRKKVMTCGPISPWMTHQQNCGSKHIYAGDTSAKPRLVFFWGGGLGLGKWPVLNGLICNDLMAAKIGSVRVIFKLKRLQVWSML